MLRKLAVFAALQLLAGCQTSCPAWRSDENPGGATYALEHCSDGQSRGVTCRSRPRGGFTCACSVGGIEESTFEAPATGLITGPNLDRAGLNEGCGWELEVP